MAKINRPSVTNDHSRKSSIIITENENIGLSTMSCNQCTYISAVYYTEMLLIEMHWQTLSYCVIQATYAIISKNVSKM